MSDTGRTYDLKNVVPYTPMTTPHRTAEEVVEFANAMKSLAQTAINIGGHAASTTDDYRRGHQVGGTRLANELVDASDELICLSTALTAARAEADGLRERVRVLTERLEKVEKAEKVVSPIVCPFCGDGDFDKMGLKMHIERGWCDEYTNAAAEQARSKK